MKKTTRRETERQRIRRRLRSGKIPIDAPPTPRGADRMGENNPISVLTWESVRKARQLRREDPRIWTVQRLADYLGVGYTTMYHVVKGLTWKESE